MERVDLGDGAWTRYDPQWLGDAEATHLLARLVDEIAWDHKPIRVFGRDVMQPRLVGWAGDVEYRYSGQTLPCRPLAGALAEITAAVEAAVGGGFNHVLLNRYRDGHDHMGMHSDAEPELGRNPLIAALSLGVPRRFRLVPKDKRRKRDAHTIILEHGSLLVMGGTIQHRWRHGVPKMASLGEERINVTFRRLLGPPGYKPWLHTPESA